MASVVNRPNGHRWIQFMGPARKRKTIRLGVVNLADANEFKRQVERLLSAKMLGKPFDYNSTMWLAELPIVTMQKLAAVGLVDGADGPHTLSELIAAHDRALNVADSTKGTLKYYRDNLKKFFSEDRDISTITPAEADEFRAWLPSHGSYKKGYKLADTTCSRMAKRAKQMFEFAEKKKKWLTSSPFAHMTGWKDSNRERDFYVSTELASRVIDAGNNAEFRAIVALSRGAALRCPSEIRMLRWEWIDWDGGWMRVRAPKNRRYEGKEVRDVPLFPVCRKYLQELYDQASDGELIFPNHQVTGAAITGELERACRSIGVALWPKPWQNMRASCETDLVDRGVSVQVVTAWVGHSPRVMLKHYAQIVKEHHTRAMAWEFTSPFAAPALATSKAKQKAKRQNPSKLQ